MEIYFIWFIILHIIAIVSIGYNFIQYKYYKSNKIDNLILNSNDVNRTQKRLLLKKLIDFRANCYNMSNYQLNSMYEIIKEIIIERNKNYERRKF